jgi:hypothetical protein
MLIPALAALLTLQSCADEDYVDDRNSCERYADEVYGCYDDAYDAGLGEDWLMDFEVSCEERDLLPADQAAIYQCLDDAWSAADCETVEGLVALTAAVGDCQLITVEGE